MRKDLKITDAEADRGFQELLNNTFQKAKATLEREPGLVTDEADIAINDEDEAVVIEDTCCKDDEEVEVEAVEAPAEETEADNTDDMSVKVLKAKFENTGLDKDTVDEIAEDAGCEVENFTDDEIVLAGTYEALNKALSNDEFDLNEDIINEILVAAAEDVRDTKDDEAEEAEAEEEAPAEDEDKKEAKAADAVFTEEEINLLKQLAAMAPDIIAAAEKANKEEAEEEVAEDPDDGSLTAGEDDDEEDEEEDVEESAVGEMVADLGEEDTEVEDCDTVVHDSKAAFGSIERHNSAVNDSIDEDLDLINLWNKRYGG